MTDSIVNKIKQKQKLTYHKNNEETTTSLPIRNILPDIYNQHELQNRSLVNLEGAVDKINTGQRQLEVIKRMESSSVYRGAITVYDWISKCFGAKTNRPTDIYQLFNNQQNNVNDLNSILAGMVKHYDKELAYTSATLDNLMDSAGVTGANVGKGEDIFIPLLEAIKESEKELKKYNQDLQPEEFYKQQKVVRHLNKELRQKRASYIGDMMTFKSNQRRISTLNLQEEIFETLLENTKLMCVSTFQYQEELNDSARIWEGTQGLANAVKLVQGGINILEEYRQDLNSKYMKTIADLTSITSNQIQTSLVEDASDSLKVLLSDVKQVAYSNVKYLGK